MNIKEASISDLSETAKLFDEYRQFYKQKPDFKGAEKFIEERIIKQESKIYLLMDGNAYCGFTQLYPIFTSLSMKRAWILNDLFVRPKYRKKGGGRALIEETAKFARDTGAKYIPLSTAFDNHTAQKLYESIGFIKDEEFFYYTWVI